MNAASFLPLHKAVASRYCKTAISRSLQFATRPKYAAKPSWHSSARALYSALSDTIVWQHGFQPRQWTRLCSSGVSVIVSHFLNLAYHISRSIEPCSRFFAKPHWCETPELQLQCLYPPMFLPFWPRKPRAWFAQGEAVFNLRFQSNASNINWSHRSSESNWLL